jgi:hypothetical protein
MLFAAGLIIAACGGTTPAATGTPGGGTPTGVPTGGATATPTPATTPGSTPSATNQPPAAAVCAAFGTMDPNNPLVTPVVVPDPTLEAHFPAQIDGSSASEVQSGAFAQYWCFYGAQGIQQLQNSAGYDLSKLTWGQAKYTVDDDGVTVLGFRIPGGDGNQIVATLAQLVALSGNAEDLGQVSQGTVAGKNVYIITHDDGTKDYGWVTGDTLLTAGGLTDSQAQKVLSALQ